MKIGVDKSNEGYSTNIVSSISVTMT